MMLSPKSGPTGSEFALSRTAIGAPECARMQRYHISRMASLAGATVSYWGTFPLFHYLPSIVLVSCIMLAITTAIALSPLAAIFWKARRVRRSLEGILTPGELGHYRVRVRAEPQRARRALEAPSDALFEPQIFHSGLGARVPRRVAIGAYALAIPAVLIVHYFWARGPLQVPQVWVWRGWIFHGVFELSTGVLLGRLLAIALWPTYFRVLPGRLDVLTFSSFRSGLVAMRKFDLRTDAVEIDLCDGVVRVGRSDDGLDVGIYLMPRGQDFAMTLLRAATSTCSPPPIPDDEFVT